MDSWMGNSADPVSLHKYLYANADPVGMIDPSGQFSLSSTLHAIDVVSKLATVASVSYNIGSFFVSDEKIEDRVSTVAKDTLLSLLPLGTFKALMKASGLKNVSVQSETVYRYMTRAELEAIKIYKSLRGNRGGTTYFTNDVYGSAKQAKSRLALGDNDFPEVRVKVRVKNNPRTIRRGTVKATPSESGGGTEYFTTDPVFVDVLEVTDLK